MRYFVLAVLVAALAGCGGGSKRVQRAPSAPVVMYATGPMSQACLGSDRKARSKALCGCIQAVANLHLSGSEQKLAASFFSDPQRIRQSDRSGHEAFWKRYSAMGEQVETTCRAAA
jgi:hypothetical protein